MQEKELIALCGKDASLPLAEYQSPQVLKFIRREDFIDEVAHFSTTHRNFILVTMHDLAAAELLKAKEAYPERPFFLNNFLFDRGQAVCMAFLTLDYSGA